MNKYAKSLGISRKYFNDKHERKELNNIKDTRITLAVILLKKLSAIETPIFKGLLMLCMGKYLFNQGGRSERKFKRNSVQKSK